MRRISTWVRERARRISPLAILVVGWLGVVLYANPGYLSYESIQILADARNGHYRDLAAVIWRVVDTVIPGPFGVLALQTTCMLAGLYLAFCRILPSRVAAICACGVLWFPPISGTLSVVWTDAQAAGWLMLGAGCLFSPRLRTRIAGLVALALGGAMVRGGAALLLPLVVGLGVVERPARVARERRWRGHAVDLAVWLVTAAVTVGLGARWSRPPTVEQAQVDIAGTLHHGAHAADAALMPAFAGTPPAGLEAIARAAYDPARPLADARAAVARAFGAPPRDAAARARDAIVSSDRGAYLAYRADVARQLLQLANRPTASQAYVWFTDVQDLSGSAGLIQHGAATSRLQRVLQPAMLWFGTTPLFVPYIYLLIALALLPLWVRDREAGALIASGIAGELAMLWFGQDPLFRSSLWLAVTTLAGAVILFARRAALRRNDGRPS